MKRRSFVVGAAAVASAAPIASRATFAQSGKPVFLGYSQDQLNQAYDQSVWAPQVNELLLAIPEKHRLAGLREGGAGYDGGGARHSGRADNEGTSFHGRSRPCFGGARNGCRAMADSCR